MAGFEVFIAHKCRHKAGKGVRGVWKVWKVWKVFYEHDIVDVSAD